MAPSSLSVKAKSSPQPTRLGTICSRSLSALVSCTNSGRFAVSPTLRVLSHLRALALAFPSVWNALPQTSIRQAPSLHSGLSSPVTYLLIREAFPEHLSKSGPHLVPPYLASISSSLFFTALTIPGYHILYLFIVSSTEMLAPQGCGFIFPVRCISKGLERARLDTGAQRIFAE